MVDNREDIETQITRFLRGEATPEQAMELMEWRDASDDNRNLYDAIEKIYHAANRTQPYKEGDIEERWKQVDPDNRPKLIPLWKRYELYAAVAAVVFIAFILANLWDSDPQNAGVADDNDGRDSSQVEQTHYYAEETTNTVILDDRSTVLLEKGSTLELLPGYNANDRRVKLIGSAEFNVEHDETKEFSVSVDGLTIVDIGTVFDVRSMGDTVRVVVSEGEVQLQLNSETLNISAGDSAYYVISEHVIDKYQEAEKRQDTVFEFDGTKLSDVMTVLSKFFNREIVIMNDQIRECPVSVTFKNENLATILDIISELLDIEIKTNNKIIEVHGTSCS